MPIASSAGVMAWPQRSHRQRAMLELSLKCMGCTHPHPQAAQAIIILTKNQNTANFKKIRSQRFKAQDPKPKVQYQRCKAKDPKPKISSQGSHAKDPTPKTPSQRLEKLPPKMQHQGPQAKNPKPWIPRHATTPRKPT